MKTNFPFLRTVCCALIFSFLSMPVAQVAHAEMISTESFLESSSRDRINSLLEKKEVLAKLQELGVTPSEARARVASLSNKEVADLNAKIDELPAGADAVGAIIGAAVFVFIVLLVTDLLCLTKVFKFTRCATK